MTECGILSIFAPMKRRVIIWTILLTVGLLSCRPAANYPQPPVGKMPEEPTWRTDSFRYEATNANGACEVYFDYPVSGPPKAVESVRTFIRSQLFEQRTQDVPVEPDEMAKAYCEERLSRFGKVLDQMQVGPVDRDEAPEEGIEIRLIDLGAQWCSYEVYRYSYLTGGAHGEYTQYGVTFRLSDGHRLTGSDLLLPVDEGLYTLIRRGMREYFEVGTDEELQSICHVDLSLHPMPSHLPYLTRQGLRFHYSIYDVCPFEYGDPAFTIPYDEIKPYLAGTASRLVFED